jgi:pimeloyl-ACP methyl ester carboxylesterase
MSIESFQGPGGAQLYYRYDDFTDPWVDAPTAVLCHGHPRNSNLWYEWVPLLARRLRVVRVDLRGLGLSKVPIETFKNSVESRILDALALFDHLGREKVVWIGEATGALTGLSLAARAPQRLHALAIMSLHLRPGRVQLDKNAADLKPGETVQGEGSIELMLSKGMRQWANVSVRARPRMRQAAQGYVDWYVDQISQNDPLLAAEFYRAMGAVDAVPWLKDIGAPTLYLAGSSGDAALREEERAALVNAPNVRTVTVDGPGYDLGYARPEACAGEVLKFLTGLGVLQA